MCHVFDAHQFIDRGFSDGSKTKNLSSVQETQVQTLCQADPLEKGMATYSNILAWKIPWTEEPGGLQSTGKQSRTWQSLTLSLFFHHRKPCSKNDYSPFTQREMRHKKLYKLSKVAQLLKTRATIWTQVYATLSSSCQMASNQEFPSANFHLPSKSGT